MSPDKPDVLTLKKPGYMKQKQKDLFVVQLRMPCGNVTSEHLAKISAPATKYGSGYIHITTRQGIQIPNTHIKDLDVITEELKDNEKTHGSCGPRVHNIISCPDDIKCNLDRVGFVKFTQAVLYDRQN